MSLSAEYALAQARAAQHHDPTLPELGVNDWALVRELRDAYREARRPRRRRTARRCRTEPPQP
ncbi:hypothetical protein [Streptomyces sp. NPDC002889]|uniref:hypothetical protein n=1 Tax=Streptomyces sp. NPDC002889 TaxID=3364669 RepID=UPI0036C32CA1